MFNTIITSVLVGAAAVYIGYKLGDKESEIHKFVNRLGKAYDDAKDAAIKSWNDSAKDSVQVQQNTPQDAIGIV